MALKMCPLTPPIVELCSYVEVGVYSHITRLYAAVPSQKGEVGLSILGRDLGALYKVII